MRRFLMSQLRRIVQTFPLTQSEPSRSIHLPANIDSICNANLADNSKRIFEMIVILAIAEEFSVETVQESKEFCMPLDHEQFVLETIGVQGRLHAYILSLVLDRDVAKDLLQQTNLVLLEKENDFAPGTNFGAWASRVAYFEVLAYRRNMTREKLIFNDALLEIVSEVSEEHLESHEFRKDALDECISGLSAIQRDLLRQRYGSGTSVAAMAKSMNTNAAALSSRLYRIRSILLDCIRRKMAGAT